MSRMLRELSAKDVPEIGGDAFSFLNQFSGPFSATEPSESKSAVGILSPIFFSSFVILIRSHLPVCLMKLINHCFGRGPHRNAAGAANGWEQTSLLLQLFLKTGLDGSKWFRMRSPSKTHHLLC